MSRPRASSQAQREALGLLGRLGEGAEVMVIEAGVQPRVARALHPRARPGVLARSGALEGHDLPNRLGEGDPHRARARRRGPAGGDPRLHRRGPPRRRRRARVTTCACAGSASDSARSNVGITSLAVRRNYFGAFNSQAFVSFVNFSRRAAELLAHADAGRRDAGREDADPRARRCGAPSCVPFTRRGRRGRAAAARTSPTISPPTTSPTRSSAASARDRGASS